jgi:pheromone a factor receptor
MADVLYTVGTGIATLLMAFTMFVCYNTRSNPHASMLLCIWVFSYNLLTFIDSIIWSSPNTEDWWDGKIYCDINIRLKLAAMIGVPGASIGVLRFLADVTKNLASDEEVGIQRNAFVGYLFGLIIPVGVAGLKIFTMPVRYWIVGVGGCTSVTATVWPAFLLYFMWAPLLSIIASIFAGNTYLNLVNSFSDLSSSLVETSWPNQKEFRTLHF